LNHIIFIDRFGTYVALAIKIANVDAEAPKTIVFSFRFSKTGNICKEMR